MSIPGRCSSISVRRGVRELFPDLQEFGANDTAQGVRIDQDLEQPADALEKHVELPDDLFPLETGQAVQAKIENRLRLRLAHSVCVSIGPLHQAEPGGKVVGLGRVGAGAVEHVPHGAGLPLAVDEALPGLRRAGGRPDERDDRVDVGERDREPFQNVRPLPRLAKLEYRPARHHLAAVAHERIEHFANPEQPGLPVDQRDEVDAEHRLHRGEPIQVVQHDLGILAAAQLDDDAHSFLVGFVAQRRNSFDSLLLHELRDFLQQPGLVDLIRKLGDDDSFLGSSVNRLESGPRAYVDAAAPGAVCIVNPGSSADDSRGWKVRTGNDLNDFVDTDFGLVEQRDTGVDHLAEIVGWNVGGHADRDSRRAIDQQVREPRGEHRGLDLGAVVVGGKVDRFLVDVGEKLVRGLPHAHFGIPHRGGGVAIHGTEVALTVDEHGPHRERLRHAHQCVVDCALSVGVVLAYRVADYPGRLLVGLVPVIAQLTHGVEHPPVDRFQAVSNIGKRPAHDHAHGVIEIGLLHLLLDVYVKDFLREISHGDTSVARRRCGGQSMFDKRAILARSAASRAVPRAAPTCSLHEVARRRARRMAPRQRRLRGRADRADRKGSLSRRTVARQCLRRRGARPHRVP